MILRYLLLLFYSNTIYCSITLKTDLGFMLGATVKSEFGGNINMFKRVPFAAPPVGQLRFALPQPPEAWKGVLNATAYGPACLSNSTTSSTKQKWVDEDCLHANIFTSDRCLNSKEGCPVTFYIHGGGFSYGSAVMFDDEYIIKNFADQDIVFVVAGFRLGFTAHLTFDDDSIVPRNIPTYDIIAALQFVQDHIDSFGGNRKDVSLFGHSNGGSIIMAMAFSKTVDPNKRLFQKAVAMSKTSCFADLNVGHRNTWTFAYRANCSPILQPYNPSPNFVREVVQCLRKIDQREFLRIQRELEEEGAAQPEGFYMVGPLFEAESLADFFSGPPEIPFDTGNGNTEIVNMTDPTVYMMAEQIASQHPIAVAKKYFYDHSNGLLNFNFTTESQALFVSAVKLLTEMSAAGATTYLYSYRNPKHPRHTDDQFYITGVHNFNMDENEQQLDDIYPKLFTNFIKFGKPNDDWRPFNPKLNNYYYIDVNVTDGTMPHNAIGYEKEVVSYWLNDLVEYDKQLTAQDKIDELGNNAETRAKPLIIAFRTNNSSDLVNSLVDQYEYSEKPSMLQSYLFNPTEPAATILTYQGNSVQRPQLQSQATKSIAMILRVVLLLHALFSSCYSITLKTDFGLVLGATTKSEFGGNINMFKRVPFAAPPVGELRFALPQPPTAWTGVLNATAYGPACLSNSTTTSSPQKWVDEDCLHVNIFTSDRCLNAKKGCPVAFYIHGGGFNYDSAVMFKDEYIVKNFADQDIVFVVAAFRLGFSALLTFDDDSVVPRNIPTYDIIAALQFVQDHIGSFGGNRKDVSLFGHSNGGSIIMAMAFSKTVDPRRKLFHKAVAMSQSSNFADLNLGHRDTWTFAHRANCSPTLQPYNPSPNFVREVVQCLRKIDQREFLRIQRELEEEGAAKPEGFYMVGPLFEAESIADFFSDPPELPLVTGTVSREMETSNDPAEYMTAEQIGARHPIAVSKKYQADRNQGLLDFNFTSETQAFFVSAVNLLTKMTEAGATTYLYSYRNPKHPKHTDDLSYIMGVHLFDRDENEQQLAAIYPKLFTTFIKTGKPNDDWRPFNPKLNNYYYIDVNITDGSMPHNAIGYEKEVVSYWLNDQLKYDAQLTAQEKIEQFKSKLPHKTKPFSISFRTDNSSDLVNSLVNQFEYSEKPSMLQSLLISAIIFLFGVVVGRILPTSGREDYIIVAHPNEKTPLNRIF